MERLVSKRSIFDFFSTSICRRVLVILLFLCMMINGFMPKSVESRNSLFMIVAAVAGNVAIELVEGCRDTLTVISNEVAQDLCKFLGVGDTSTKAPAGDSKKEEPIPPINMSSDNGLIAERRDSNQQIDFSIEGNLFAVESIFTAKLYRLYNNVKVCCSQVDNVGLLFFILFVGAIRRRKEISESILLCRIGKYKTDLR